MNLSWVNVPLGEVLTQRSEVPSEEAITNGEIPVIAKISFNNGTIELRQDAQTRTEMILVRPGDLIVSGINAAKGAIAIYGGENTKPIAATIHYSAYIPNKEKVDVQYLWRLLRSSFFHNILIEHIPGGIKTELKARRFLQVPIPLPPLDEQQRIVARIEELAARIEKVRDLREEITSDARKMLLSVYRELITGAKEYSMVEVVPLIRRPVHVDPEKEYHELGIRSFGKGTFHKPTVEGASLGTKRIFRIEANDLLFNIVFAWEGAVAVARQEDHGLVGSHRFLTCVPKSSIATSSFLCFHFLTPRGLEQLGEASPGGAGRNRTLGINALEKIKVPVPRIEKQVWFDRLQAKLRLANQLQSETLAELDALLPSILYKAFKGEL
jgi:type I restriction enzyme S subunit